MASKLNAAKLRTLTKPSVYGDGGGLYLQVRDANRRSWVYCFMLHGKARWMGLGTVADLSLAEAREAAQSAHKQVRAQGTIRLSCDVCRVPRLPLELA